MILRACAAQSVCVCLCVCVFVSVGWCAERLSVRLRCFLGMTWAFDFKSGYCFADLAWSLAFTQSFCGYDLGFSGFRLGLLLGCLEWCKRDLSLFCLCSDDAAIGLPLPCTYNQLLPQRGKASVPQAAAPK